ncbi:hypothetical protein GGR56DRAFT_263215 [Xylariaceae sp. FL0804]|nr:hypothetical protein GGR56DRAFT_263215 [Xylariaceae sp. FL0804]
MLTRDVPISVPPLPFPPLIFSLSLSCLIPTCRLVSPPCPPSGRHHRVFPAGAQPLWLKCLGPLACPGLEGRRVLLEERRSLSLLVASP